MMIIMRNVRSIFLSSLILSSSAFLTNAFSSTTTTKHHTKSPTVFKHLFRHYDDVSFDSYLRCIEADEFLQSVGLKDLNVAANNMDVHSQLAPKVRFLVETLHAGSGHLMWHDADCHDHDCRVDADLVNRIPKEYWNCRLDRHVGPKHAYLVHHDIHPNGRELLEDDDSNKFAEFINVCNSGNAKSFVKLCNDWSSTNTQQQQQQHTLESFYDFEHNFGPGLIPNICHDTNTHGGDLVELLLQHGANHIEKDRHYISSLHWAAGLNQVHSVQALLRALWKGRGCQDPYIDIILQECAPKDGATAFHWACCGVEPVLQPECGTICTRLATGGAMDVAKYMMDLCQENNLSELINAPTWVGSTPLMWAAWGNGLEMVKLLIDNGADVTATSNDGLTVAHVAAAAGSLEIVEYLMPLVDFTTPDKDGKTPMDYAKEYNHPEIATWIQHHCIYFADEMDKEVLSKALQDQKQQQNKNNQQKRQEEANV